MRFIACGLLVAPASLIAQSVVPAVAVPIVAPILAPVTGNATLRTGTEVPLRLSEELTTKGKKLRVGHRFRLETSAPVVVQGVTVIPAGSPAMGEVTDVRNKGGWASRVALLRAYCTSPSTAARFA